MSAPEALDIRSNGANVTPGQVFAINQTLSALAFALDFGGPKVDLGTILASDFYYEICAGGQRLIGQSSTREGFASYQDKVIFGYVRENKFRTRHYFANTVLNQGSNPNEVVATVSMLVMLQPLFIEAPIPDYGATLEITLLEEEPGRYVVTRALVFTDEPAEDITRAR